jgi:hypothetical protein
MKNRTGRATLLIGFVAMFAILGYLSRAALREMGQNFGNGSSDRKELLEEQTRSKQLEQDRFFCIDRSTMRTEVVMQLIAGQITLDEATDQFMTISQTGLDLTQYVREQYPAASLKQSTRLQVLAWVYGVVKEYPPDYAEAILLRLNQEMKAANPSSASVSYSQAIPSY